MRLTVFLNHCNVRRRVGILEESGGHIFFEYAPEFLKTGIELSPFTLPLKPGVHEETKGVFDGLFGLFADSLPDGWGCLLLDRKLRRKGLSYNAITPLMRLAMVGHNPFGALEYEPADEESADFAADGLSLDNIANNADLIYEGHGENGLDEIIRLAGSSGGARPKITAFVSDDGKRLLPPIGKCPSGFSEWLIKFPTRADGLDAGADEYRIAREARASGIVMPPTRLFPSARCAGYFGVRRFDRTARGKLHTHTAAGLLHASFRYSSVDYENLLRLTFALTRSVEDVKQMARRMAFNVRIGNKDDHAKNVSFLLDEHLRWRLAPAYDLTRSDGINGEHTAMVNGKGANITRADLLAAATAAGLSLSDAESALSIQRSKSGRALKNF